MGPGFALVTGAVVHAAGCGCRTAGLLFPTALMLPGFNPADLDLIWQLSLGFIALRSLSRLFEAASRT